MKHSLTLLLFLFFLITLTGCKEVSEEYGNPIFELPAVPDDSKLVWQAVQMAPTDINLWDYRSQLHSDGENIILTCLPESSSTQDTMQSKTRDGRQYRVQGNTLQRIPADWLKESQAYGVAVDCFFREDGSILLLYCNENNIYTIRDYNPENNTFQDSNKIPPKGIALAKLTELSDGTLLLFDAENYMAYAYAPHAVEYSTRFKAGYRNGCVDMGGGTAAVSPIATSGYVVMNCLTGQQQTEALTPKELFETGSLHYSQLFKEGDSFLLLNGLGLYQSQGVEWNLLLDATQTAMCASGFLIVDFLPKDNTLYVLSDDSLYLYTPEIMKKADTKKLTIVSCLPNPFIQNAIINFRQQYPEVEINYETLVKKDFPTDQEIEDAIKRLNTEIISGKEMDILITNHLPFDAYGEKGILTDLSDIVADITADGGYYNNAVTGYRQNGSLYAAICAFGPVAMAVKTGTPKDIVTLDGLQKFLDSHPESTFFVPEIYAKPERLSEIMYEIYFPHVIERNGKVSKERLALYMNVWKTIYDRMQAYSSTENSGSAYMPKELSYLVQPDSPAATALLTEQSCNIWITPIRRDDLELLIPGTFEAGTTIGICGQSPEPELAEEFFRFLFLEETQETADGSNGSNLLSVNKAVNRKLLKRNAAFFTELGQGETYESEGVEGIFEMYTVREEDTDTLFSLYEKVNIPFKRIFSERRRKDDLYHILYENGMAYVTEQSGYEEAFQNVCNGIFLYEQERE